jgi:hypothetical protein
MKFHIDRTIDGSYPMELIHEESNDFLGWTNEEYRQERKSDFIELSDEVIKGWIDEDGMCHRIRKETIEVIEVNTIEELHTITVKYGKIVFNSFAIHEGIDGWIEIYDDYRE